MICRVGSYVRVIGRTKSINNIVYLFAFRIHLITDISEISLHFIDAITHHKSMPKFHNLSEEVLSAIQRNSNLAAGIGWAELKSMVKKPEPEIRSAINMLLEEGFIYCTVDDGKQIQLGRFFLICCRALQISHVKIKNLKKTNTFF